VRPPPLTRWSVSDTVRSVNASAPSGSGPAELSLDGRVAIVTGGSRSIGRATARVLAEAGADVVLAGRSQAGLERAAAEVEEAGRRAVPLVCDVTRPEDVDEVVRACKRELGPPDVAIANAGVFQEWGPTQEMSLQEWDRVVATDLTGVMLTCRACGREMLADGRGGSVVTVASIAGLVALPGAAAYTAAKFGVVGLTKALAAEWAGHGIRVNAVAPGFIEREEDTLPDRPDDLARVIAATPLGRRGRPREAAMAALFLASPAASYITGAVLAVDGGWVSV
jgi:NAD(P)-dependent dehydrogenase (short-subunit alcohol dehydrogenase family)